jgi:hypothetical protein
MHELKIPSYEEFLEKLFSINPIGNSEMIYELTKQRLGKKLPTGEILTFELLVERYSGYMAYLKPYNNIKDKQYIKKDKEIKHIGGYLLDSLYINDFGANVNDPADSYLFGL